MNIIQKRNYIWGKYVVIFEGLIFDALCNVLIILEISKY